MKLILNSHRQTAKFLLGYHNHIIQTVYIDYSRQHLHLSTGTIPYIEALRVFIVSDKKKKHCGIIWKKSVKHTLLCKCRCFSHKNKSASVLYCFMVLNQLTPFVLFPGESLSKQDVSHPFVFSNTWCIRCEES